MDVAIQLSMLIFQKMKVIAVVPDQELRHLTVKREGDPLPNYIMFLIGSQWITRISEEGRFRIQCMISAGEKMTSFKALKDKTDIIE